MAALFLRIPNALMMGLGMRSVSLAISKFSIDLCVCAAQSLSDLTLMGPKVSFSSLYSTLLQKYLLPTNANLVDLKNLPSILL